MIHEGLQRNIISEDCLCVSSTDTAIGASCVCSRWVQLGQEEACLGATGVADNESRKREAVGDQFLSGISIEQLCL